MNYPTDKQVVYPNKIYCIFLKETLIDTFTDKKEAYKEAERQFGCLQDGICIDDVCIVSYTNMNEGTL